MRREWKFIQIAAEVDLSLPVDHCGTGVSDSRSGRSRTGGTFAGMTGMCTRTTFNYSSNSIISHSVNVGSQ